jgi:Flp pilus assembly protein TadG
MLVRRMVRHRRGTILPMLALALVGLCGMVALAVDVGMILVARTECQNAADLAAMAGARGLAGSAGGNVSSATSAALAAATANKILSQPIQASEVTIQHGAYHYDTTAQAFQPQYPPGSGDNYNLTQATITHDVSLAFARVFNQSTFNVVATAVAAHEPRDVAIVLDYSGSMNNESDLWNVETYLGSLIGTSNNLDPALPQFGPYDPTFSPLASLQCTSSDPRTGKCNVTQSVLGVPPLVNDFYQNGRGAAGTPAFNPAPASVTPTSPGGDQYLFKKNTTTPAKNWQEITGSSSVAFAGYPSFNGSMQGPGYWGMTFYIWPPDPRAANDWRKKFFLKSGGSYPNFGGPVDDDRLLWGSNGVWQSNPPGNYVINYRAILSWIRANCVQSNPADPRPFPPVLRAGSILYYDQIPTDVPASAYDHTQKNYQVAWVDQNQRFWKEYIDFVIGVWRDPYGNIQSAASPACSYGSDFTCGSSTGGQGVVITGPDAPDPSGNSYVAATDNPKRPRHRFWFGPMTMVQFLSDTGLLPGTAHDISMIAAKLGIAGALQDIQNNHPNDLVSMILFSRPHYSGEPAEGGAFSQAQSGLGRDYSGMIHSLWFPPNVASSDVRPWDPNGLQTPRAHGDYVGNTATSYGLMLAYNQFSSSSVVVAQQAGGLGRRGARRLVILETDGMANVATQAGFTNSGANNSYYNILPTDTVTVDGSTDPAQAALNVGTRICALDTDMANGPGFATARKPVLIHCLGFGAVFEPTASGTEPAQAMAFLQQLSAIGGTGFPSSLTDTSDPNYFKLCTGTLQQRQDKLRQAFTKAMDGGVAVLLVK